MEMKQRRIEAEREEEEEFRRQVKSSSFHYFTGSRACICVLKHVRPLMRAWVRIYVYLGMHLTACPAAAFCTDTCIYLDGQYIF